MANTQDISKEELLQLLKEKYNMEEDAVQVWKHMNDHNKILDEQH